jgi:hypothetical protein
VKKLIAAVSLMSMLSVAFPVGAQSQDGYNGIWQSTAKAVAGSAQTVYIAMYQTGTTLYGIVYQCATTNVLPCTWTDTLVITIPGGVISPGTAYSVVDHTPFSVYTASLTFTNASTFTLTKVSCSAYTEPDYIPPPSTATYATENSACSQKAPFSTLQWMKII